MSKVYRDFDPIAAEAWMRRFIIGKSIWDPDPELVSVRMRLSAMDAIRDVHEWD